MKIGFYICVVDVYEIEWFVTLVLYVRCAGQTI